MKTDQSSHDVIGRVRSKIVAGDLDEARNELKRAMTMAQRKGDRLGESAYISLLASIYVIEGDDQTALAYYRQAEDIEPNNASNMLATARQLLRMKLNDEAATLCRAALSRESLDASDRHEAFTILGRALVATNPAEAKTNLLKAQTVAEETKLPAILWDQMLAENLARRGDKSGFEYFRALRAQAIAQNSTETADLVDGILRELEGRRETE